MGHRICMSLCMYVRLFADTIYFIIACDTFWRKRRSTVQMKIKMVTITRTVTYTSIKHKLFYYFRRHFIVIVVTITNIIIWNLFYIISTQDWHGIINCSLAGLLLLGSSTLVGITLIVQSELDTRKSPMAHMASGMRGAIALSWFLPVLYAVAGPLVYTITGKRPEHWWLELRSFSFVLFVIIEMLFVILFCLLFFTLFRKLLFLAKKHDKHNATIVIR